MDSYEVIVAGGGPAGLACAEVLAGAGVRTLLLERHQDIGGKVCAGGITWHGLIRQVPEHLIERTFTEQYIFSNRQQIRFRRPHPVIATVGREALGRWMAEQARHRGAHIRTGCRISDIGSRTLAATDEAGRSSRLRFDHLVGADGSSSAVRRFLAVPAKRMGFGVTWQVPGSYPHMEWHLNTRLFGNGYGWIFPHRQSVSVGAYCPGRGMTPARFKQQSTAWAANRGFDLQQAPARAALINYDYRGWRFNNIWLVGDAAGFASGLTGEGINPAILSGQAAARKIIDPGYQADEIRLLLKKKARHEQVVALSAGSGALCTLLMEMLVAMLRMRLVDFQKQLSM